MTPQIIRGACCYRGGFVIDADGAPDAYKWDDTGRDYLENAHSGTNFFGVVTNGFGVPVRQGASDPCPGYYVSTTSLQNPYKAATDPNRYVDARSVPYISVARDLLFRPASIRVGDLAWVVYKDMEWGAVVADVGPHGKYGEGSPALADRLGIPSSCRWRTERSGVEDGVTWLVFPGSSISWPATNDAILAASQALFNAWGGQAKLGDVI